MNNNNLQRWWQNTYHHHLTQQQLITLTPNIYQFPTLDPQLAVVSSLSLLTTTTSNESDAELTTASILEASSRPWEYIAWENETFLNPYDVTTGLNNISSLTLMLMAFLYGLVVIFGVLGNASLVLTLCSAHSVRLRNPLLLAVCLADLLVTGISAPITLLNLAMNQKTNSLTLVICKIINFAQVMPVAASTLSFFLLSLDRYATVKHPRLTQLRQRRYLHLSLALFSWLISALVSTPFLFAYKIFAKTILIKKVPKQSLTHRNGPHTVPSDRPNISISNCHSEWNASSLFVIFIIFHTLIVFVLPGLGVLLNHYGVRRKLCALSLTARAAHGELPLPMPILRRQTHMVIVTGISSAKQVACGSGTADDTANCADMQLHSLNPPSILTNRNVVKSSNPISPRAMREIRNHSQRQRIHTGQESRRGGRVATPGIPLPQTSTLRSRRHLANLLIASALIFIACWLPHVFCVFYKHLGYKQYCSTTSTYFNLLLGYMYSAISPVIYWALNHNSLRQSPCAPLIRLRSVQKYLNSRFRSHTAPPPPSSTNEAALGAFNPKLIKSTPKQYRAQASSHYLY
uniref:G-protein coupled receptors family 1 profile domain-containing protein n=1 Tax=Glossina brevipalpis TaxID=37001 RepID=A0A1A9W853_9MUSC